MGTFVSGLHVDAIVRRGDFELHVALTIEAGETGALVGPNGAGKSTVVDVVAGLVRIDEGAVRLDGKVVDDPVSRTFVRAADRRVGVVFQDYRLFEHLDVIDNVAFGLTSRGTHRREARATAQYWLDAVDLNGFEKRRPRELSGGQAQRVALARALAIQPDLLVLDEPLAALDVETRASLRRLLRDRLADHAGPRLLITHDPTDAFLLADRIHVLEGGRVSQQGSPDDIRRHPATSYIAALAGTNLFTGRVAGHDVILDVHDHVLTAAVTPTDGAVQVTIHPTAVALHPREPSGSPRNTWLGRVELVEPLGDTTRVVLGGSLPLTADITPAAAESLGLAPGGEIWIAVKATEIQVTPA